MTWAESSSPAGVDAYPVAPPSDGLPTPDASQNHWAARADGEPTSGIAAEMGSWEEPAVSLADESGLCAMGERAQALGYLWVELPPPGPEFRGRLGLYIEEGLENRLEQLGAPPAGIHASTSLDASLSDQLYRARFVERRGLALGIPSLEGIANLGRTLDADDSAVLRWWIAATADRPLRLVVSTKNQFLRVYPSPVLFETLFELAPEPVSPRAPSVALAESATAMEMSELPPAVASEAPAVESVIEGAPEEPSTDKACSEPTTDVLGTRVVPLFDVQLPGLDRALGLLTDDPDADEAGDGADPEARTDDVDGLDAPPTGLSFDEVVALDQAREAITVVPPPAEIEALADRAATDSVTPMVGPAEPLPSRLGALPPRIDADEFLRVLEADSRPPPTAASSPAPAPELSPPVPLPLPEKKLRRPFLQMAAEPEPMAPEILADAPAAPEMEVAQPPPSASEPPAPDAVLPAALPTSSMSPELDASDPFNQLAAKEWRTWRDSLTQAAGPRPLAAIERMFVTDYTRLAEATRRGIADHTGRAALAEWQGSFQKSYAETFDALRVRGKRPTMVLDLPDIAQRLGRLQGARRVQLLLIDGLRFDLGLMVQDRLRARVDAALTERLLLWSALPSTTTHQLELLGKGPEGLLERFDSEESPTLVARGRAARSPRRIRTGRVEVLKIDVVEDALRTLGRPVLERMGDIAADTADAIAEHMAAQPPRTLVVVFGDHGFRLDPARAGTTEEVRQGGSSPEEVLVPAFAWLTGAVH